MYELWGNHTQPKLPEIDGEDFIGDQKTVSVHGQKISNFFYSFRLTVRFHG